MAEGMRKGESREPWLRRAWRKLARDRRGAAAVEYALLASLIAVTIVGAVNATGTNVARTFNNVEKAERLTVGGN